MKSAMPRIPLMQNYDTARLRKEYLIENYFYGQ